MKYKTTKKHPDYKQGKIIKGEKDDIIFELKLSSGREAITNVCFKKWLKKGWIKPIKEKVWIICKSDNWKLFKYKKGTFLTHHLQEQFKSKKKALNYVLQEAKERFKNKAVLKKSKAEIEFFEISKTKHNVVGNAFVLWNRYEGWVAEPVKYNNYDNK